MKNASVTLRNGDFFQTQIDTEENTSSSLAIRMMSTSPGYLITTESRWGKERTLIVNLSDVTSIVIDEEEA
jgi:hypothetical protein